MAVPAGGGVSWVLRLAAESACQKPEAMPSRSHAKQKRRECWIPLAAADDIFDAASESVSFTIEDLDPGEHRVALRVYDEQGNMRYVTRAATIGN